MFSFAPTNMKNFKHKQNNKNSVHLLLLVSAQDSHL